MCAALVLFLLACAAASPPPPVLYMPLYQNYFVSVQVGADSSAKQLRVRFDCDHLAVYGAPAGGTYNAADSTDLVTLAPTVTLRLPVLYTYQGDARVSDPIATNMRVSYSGVLGLGPGSALWRWYDSWTLQRSQLVLGAGLDRAAAERLPPAVRITPQRDHSTIRDLELFLRWAAMLGGGGSSDTGADIGAAMSLYQAAAAGRAVQSSSARQLNQLAKIVLLANHDGNASRVSRTMIVPLADDYAIELDAYWDDSTSGNPIEMVRFAAANITGGVGGRSRSLDDEYEDAALEVGLIHARDHTISGDAAQSVVLLSRSRSGPFRASQLHYTWIFLACLIVSLTHMPGLSELVNRARLLYMPLAQPIERVNELAGSLQDWTLLHLLTRWVLVCAVWVMHASLVASRSLRELNTERGGALSGWLAYYGTVAYALALLVLAPVRYPDHRSVARFTAALYLCGVCLLSVHFEDYTNALLSLMLAWRAFYAVADMNLSDWLDDSSSSSDASAWLPTALLSTAETLFVGWFAAFYVTDAMLRAQLPQIPLAVLIEFMLVATVWMRFVFLVASRARAVNMQANAALLARKLADQIDEALKIDAEQQRRLAAESKPTAAEARKEDEHVPAIQSSLAQFHLGMSAAQPLDAV